MKMIIPKEIFWFSSSTGKDALTIHLTTNPKAENWIDETIGSEAKVKRKLSKFQYFDLTVATDVELHELVQQALGILRYRQQKIAGLFDDMEARSNGA